MIEATGKELAAKPYKSIWAACLLQVIDDCWLSSNTKDKSKNNENVNIRDDARNYVNRMSRNPGGFYWVCDIFDLDPIQTSNKILYERNAVSELRKRVETQNKRRRAHELKQ